MDTHFLFNRKDLDKNMDQKHGQSIVVGSESAENRLKTRLKTRLS